MSSKQEASRDFFDRWARFYGNDPFSRWVRRAQHRALESLELGAEDRVLDVGCGPGAAVIEAAPQVAHATGLDLSPVMVQRARDKAQGLANAEFVEADSGQMPFADGAFTALMSTTSFHHYPQPERALGEMQRVLAPAGRLAIGDLSSDRFVMRGVDAFCTRFEEGHVHFYRAGELTDLVTAAGFRDVSSRPLLGGLYTLVTAVGH